MSRMDALGEKVGRVLVVRMSAIGDVILTLAVLDALASRFPGAKIDYATKGEFAELVGSHPRIGEVWELDRGDGFAGLRALSGKVAGVGYDLIVDLHSNPRSLYLRWKGKARMSRSYRKMVLKRLLLKWVRINLLREAAPVCDRYFTALEDFGIERNGLLPRLYLDDGARSRAGARLSESGIGEGDGYVAIAPGASFATKRWTADGFVEAAAELAGGALAVVALGGGKDREVAERIVSATAG